MKACRSSTVVVSTIVIAGCLALVGCSLGLLLAGCGGEPTSPRAKALVYVNSIPARALIHLDAVSTGKLTPDSVLVREGDHTLTLTLDGYRDSTVSFSTAREDTVSLDVRLTAIEGTFTWSRVTGIDAAVYGIDFATLTYGCGVGEAGNVFRTSSAGASWVQLNAGTSEDLLSVSFASPSVGWACGTNGVILKTTDYGDTWTSWPSTTSQDLHDVCFVNASNGWAVGDSGKILRSTDGGLSWSPRTSNTTKNLSAVYFLDITHGWVVGGNLAGEGQVILRSTNGGVTWQSSSTVSTSCLRDVFFFTSEIGLCVGDDGLVLRSTNGGISWESMGSVGSLSLRALTAWSSTDYWAVGYEYGAVGYVFRSADGGLTWYLFEETPQGLLCVDAIQGSPNGWAGSLSGLWGYE
ncbi:MAG: YCF48-related protein [Candidatus Eisenbacteria bacterium]|nr:YCF48-related protein [Candidatus Eisenbacteria bacterium]